MNTNNKTAVTGQGITPVILNKQAAKESGSRRFTMTRKFPGGHKFFNDHATGQLAIADDSGAYPDMTDDGILFVDTTRPIETRADGNYMIPLMDPDGGRTSTPSYKDEVIYLNQTLGMSVTKAPSTCPDCHSLGHHTGNRMMPCRTCVNSSGKMLPERKPDTGKPDGALPRHLVVETVSHGYGPEGTIAIRWNDTTFNANMVSLMTKEDAVRLLQALAKAVIPASLSLAGKALEGDSNDNEHDALFDLLGVLGAVPVGRKAPRYSVIVADGVEVIVCDRNSAVRVFDGDTAMSRKMAEQYAAKLNAQEVTMTRK